MAPEQVEKPQMVDHRADIYSLGVVFYEMLTGELPLGKFQPPSKRVQVDVRLDEVVLHALEKEPERRYQHASEVKSDVETIASSSAATPPGSATRPSAPPPGSSERQSVPPEDQSLLTSAATGRVSHFSRSAVVGFAWIGLFFLNWVVSYTPPGWAVTWAFRNSLSVVADLVLFLPLTVLGFAAVAGSSVMGVVALRQIRQAQGQLRGFGLALFDVLFFPMVLLNWWAAWLAGRVVSQTASGASSLAMAVLTLAGLVLNALLIRAAWRLARQFVNSPAPPARARMTGDWSQVLKATALRLVLVLAVQLALVETLEQVSVHWKESTGESWMMVQMVSALAGLIWACWPGYRFKRSWSFWVGGTVVSSLLLLLLANFYAWTLRPNLGLYREPDWVAQHPGFQKQLRQRIEKNLWRKPATTPAPTNESTLAVPQARPKTG